MAVSKALRYEVFRRDNHTCRYCGATAPDAVMQIDHVTPTTLGGNDDPANLVTACRDCNSGKRATPPGAPLVADVAQDALRWSTARQQAIAAAMTERDALLDAEKAVWAVFEGGNYYGTKGIPEDWFRSIHQFIAGGLFEGELVDAAYIAISKRELRAADRWSYFCGICWKKLRKRQDEIAAILGRGQVQTPKIVEHPKPPHGRTDCAHCGAQDCVWNIGRESGYFDGFDVGWDGGRAHVANLVGTDGHYAISLYRQLATVCDGPDA